MITESVTIYQSGEVVIVAGLYYLVTTPNRLETGPIETPRFFLRQGEIFPDYKGRAVCWIASEFVERPSKPQPEEAPSVSHSA